MFRGNIYDVGERRKIRNQHLGENTNKNKVLHRSDVMELEHLTEEIKHEIAKVFHEELLGREASFDEKVSEKIKQFLTSYLNKQSVQFEDTKMKMDFINDFIIAFSGYGILQPLIDDDTIEEIIVLGPSDIYVERGNNIVKTSIHFKNEQRLRSFLDNLLAIINKQINTKNPIADGRLPDGSRVAISGDSISPQGYSFNIRKFRKKRIDTKDLIQFGSMNREMEAFMKKIIDGYTNIIVSGGTSSGKTTLLNALGKFIGKEDFVITLEDNIELQLDRDMWLQLETRNANLEGKGEIGIFDLQKHTLRRSPTRIIIGEIRDGAVANGTLNAVQTGHRGLMCTIHADNPITCRNRMVELASENGNHEFKMEQFNTAFDVIVQVARFRNSGRRIVTHVTYVHNNGRLQDIFVYDEKSEKWDFKGLPEELAHRIESN